MTHDDAFPRDARQRRADEYRDALLHDTLPFWLRHAIDDEAGGFLFALDQAGSVVSTDKSIWIHGRFTWLLATLYSDLEPRDEWLQQAQRGLEFLERHGFADDGRMYFSVTRDGRPLRKRRYLFSECFMVMARAAVARATGDAALAQRALALYESLLRDARDPLRTPPKVHPGTRPMRGLGLPMIVLGIGKVLREALDGEDALRVTQTLDDAARELEVFVRADERLVYETLAADGTPLDTPEGRQLVPGHSLEAAWFLLDESRARGGDEWLRTLGLEIVDRMFPLGWDEAMGGILHWVDAAGLTPVEPGHDAKYWWPQNEAVLATLFAWAETGDERYLRWYHQTHDWSHEHFPDRQHGEWFGYLHRDGRIATPIKGNLWKGPFHLPRMQWRASELLRSL